jgi:Ca2+-binding RTX toxin-like protein
MQALVRASAALLVAGLLPAAPSAAAPDTCDGETVTIVGGPGEDVDGTDGDDVIVANGARSVHANDGNDRICVTSFVEGQRMDVFTGDGDDRVLVQSDTEGPTMTVFLDQGADVFEGGPGDEWVIAGLPSRVDLGAGDDQLNVESRYYAAQPARPQPALYDGGPGRDRLSAGLGQDDITIEGPLMADLERDTLVSSFSGFDDGFDIPGFEDLRVWGDEVTLRGDDRANLIQVFGCTVTVAGRAGRDFVSSPPKWENYNGCRRGMTFQGGQGRDQLRGRAGNDRLLGGPGRDRAVGNGGRDLCRAEVRVKCERR